MSFVILAGTGNRFLTWPPDSEKAVVHEIPRYDLEHHRWRILHDRVVGPRDLVDALHRYAVTRWQPCSSTAAIEQATLQPLLIFCIFGASVTYSAHFDVLGSVWAVTPPLLFTAFFAFAVAGVLNLIRLWDHRSITALGVRFTRIGFLRGLTAFATVTLMASAITDNIEAWGYGWIILLLGLIGVGVIFIVLKGRVFLSRELTVLDHPRNRAARFLQVYDLYGGGMRYVWELVPDYAMHSPEKQVDFLLSTLKAFLPECVITYTGTPAHFLELVRDAKRWYPAAEALRTRSVEDITRIPWKQRTERLLRLEKVLLGTIGAVSLDAIDGQESTQAASTDTRAVGQPPSSKHMSIETEAITTPHKRQPIHDAYAPGWLGDVLTEHGGRKQELTQKGTAVPLCAPRSDFLREHCRNTQF